VRKSLLVMILFLFAHLTALAQEACPKLVQETLKLVKDRCVQTGRNQVCYGNADLTAETRPTAADFKFAQIGDKANLVDIQKLTLGSQAGAERWGVALMQVQANLPDSLPGQNITFLLFGDVKVENAVELVTTTITATAKARLRMVPDASAPAVGTVEKGQTVQASGKTEDEGWVRISVGDRLLWISAQVVSGDLSSLPIVKPAAPALTHPMQAFYFTSGIGDRPCKDAPDSGILIQTSKGTASAQFTVNGVSIQLGSTVYLEASAGKMQVSVVEGKAIVQANGVTQFVPAGTFTEIPLDAAGHAPAGDPAKPMPYDAEVVKPLPVATTLPRSVTAATPVPPAAIEQTVQQTFAPNGLLDGFYSVSVLSFAQTKPDQYGVGYCASGGAALTGLVVKNGKPEGFKNIKIVSISEFTFSNSYSDAKTGCTATHRAVWSSSTPPG
jgi:hypothetical protein